MAQNEWVLITGAASGIGAQLSRLFARDNFNLVLVDKNRDGLEKFRDELARDFSTETIALVFDLSNPQASPRIFDELQNRKIEIDVLVNNAGFGTFGNFWKIDSARDEALCYVNILAPMLLAKLFLPSMVQRKRGKILNVGSVSGFLASPYATTYYASKAWLLSFSQGLESSLKNSGVSVTIVCPGPTYTAFDWKNSSENSGQSCGGIAQKPARKKFQMEASEVARQAYRGLKRGQSVVIPGASNQALAVLARLLPRRFALWLLTFGQQKATLKN